MYSGHQTWHTRNFGDSGMKTKVTVTKRLGRAQASVNSRHEAQDSCVLGVV